MRKEDVAAIPMAVNPARQHRWPVADTLSRNATVLGAHLIRRPALWECHPATPAFSPPTIASQQTSPPGIFDATGRARSAPG
jgi:hypothetical protein